MNRTIQLLVAFLMASGLYGQKVVMHQVEVLYHYNTKDTTRTFTFNAVSLDSCRAKFIRYWGTPQLKNAGTIIWKNVDIPGIGNKLTICVKDQWCTMKSSGDSCTTFTDYLEKSIALKNWDGSHYRDLKLEVCDNTGKNIVNNKTKTDILLHLLELIVE
jgi:hypothetical protein